MKKESAKDKPYLYLLLFNLFLLILVAFLEVPMMRNTIDSKIREAEREIMIKCFRMVDKHRHIYHDGSVRYIE